MGSGLGEVILAFGGLAWWLRPEWEERASVDGDASRRYGVNPRIAAATCSGPLEGWGSLARLRAPPSVTRARGVPLWPGAH
jgi:hypothetical protein